MNGPQRTACLAKRYTYSYAANIINVNCQRQHSPFTVLSYSCRKQIGSTLLIAAEESS